MIAHGSTTRTRPWRSLPTHGAISGVSAALSTALLSSAFTLSGCITSPLVPLTAAADDNGIVRMERAGIELTAEARPGLQHLPPRITPFRISVENRSDNGIYVDPTDIELTAGDKALALASIPTEDLPAPRTLGLGVDPLSPYATAQGSASFGAAVGGYFAINPSTAYVSGHWHDQTAWSWLTNTAFTGGFIDIGQSRSGYLYFETPPDGVDQLRLRVRVRTGSGSGPMETFDIPYGVTG